MQKSGKLGLMSSITKQQLNEISIDNASSDSVSDSEQKFFDKQ